MSQQHDHDDDDDDNLAASRAIYEESFSCLVAEFSKKASASSSSSSTSSRQRRARVVVEVPIRKGTRRGAGALAAALLFSLRIEYPSPGGGASAAAVGADNRALHNSVRFDFLSHSAFKWIVPESHHDDDEDDDATFGGAAAASVNKSAAAFDHEEYSVKFSNVAKRFVSASRQPDSVGHAAVEVLSCLITFERFLEARIFARQMHWILQVASPTRMTIDPFAAVAAGAPNSCALVALPIQWWFNAWKDADRVKIYSNNNDGDDSNSSESPAFLLSSNGPADTTWHVRDEQEEAEATASADSGSLLLGGVDEVLPLLESPAPTRHSEIAGLQWVACQSTVVLSTAMEGATLFRPSSSASSSSSSHHSAFEPVPVCTGSLNASPTEASPTTDSSSASVSSRNIANLRSVQPVLLESGGSSSSGSSGSFVAASSSPHHHHHRVMLAGKNGGLNVVQLGRKKTGTTTTATLLPHHHHEELKWDLISHRRVAVGIDAIPFVALPLQDAILAASDYNNDNKKKTHQQQQQQQQQQKQQKQDFSSFVLGSGTNAIGGVCRVLCVAGDTAAAAPRPVVLDPAHGGTLRVLAHPAEHDSIDADKRWAVTLVRACLDEKLIPVTLLPLRAYPAFVAPPPTSSTTGASSFFASSGIASTSASSPTSLESILLLSALREVSNSVSAIGGGKQQRNATTTTTTTLNVPTQTAAPLHKLRPDHHRTVTVSVVGAVGVDTPSLIAALASTTMFNRHQQGRNRAASTNSNNKPTTAAALSSSMSSASFSNSCMSDWLIFGCRCHSCRSQESASSSSDHHHHHQQHRLVRARLTEAPSQSPHATAGVVTNSDIVLLVVDCINPASLSWLEDTSHSSTSIKQVLLERRSPTLSFDKNHVQIGGPTAIIVTLNSGSYRRTVTQEQVAAVADRLRCLEVVELDFGSEEIAAGLGASSSTLAHVLSAGDSRVVTGTIGRCVQACAAYGRLVDHGGFLPLHAEWVVSCLMAMWSRLFALAAQLQDEEDAAAGDEDGDGHDDGDHHHFKSGFGFPPAVQSLFTASSSDQHTWLAREFFHGATAAAAPSSSSEAAAAAAASSSATLGQQHQHGASSSSSSSFSPAATGYVDETICEWIESDMNVSSYCRYSIADVACYLANACSARDMRGQLVKTLLLKRAVSLAAVSSSSSSPIFSSSSSRVGSLQTIKRSRKMAKKLFLLVTSSSSSSLASPRSPLMSTKSTARAMTARVNDGDDENDAGGGAASVTPKAGDDDGMTSPLTLASSSAVSFRKSSSSAAAGISPAALLFLLSTFGVVVAQRWIDALWAETSRVRLGNESLSLSTWLKLLHLSEEDHKQQQQAKRRPQQSMFTMRQLSVADFGLVALRWMVEVSKSASTQLLTDARDGWVASGASLEAEVERDKANNKAGTPTAAPGGSGFPPPPSSPLLPGDMTATCRSCKKMKPDSELLRCVVCERHCCIPVGGGKAKEKNPCCLSVGRREADQQRNALMALARTQSGGGQNEELQHRQLLSVLKKLPHVCRVCLLSHSPYPWQPDSEATSCCCCGTKYSLMFRRHHCRDQNCGRVVCNNCSKFEAAVFGYPTPERICLQCYGKESPFLPLSSSSGSGGGGQRGGTTTTPSAAEDGIAPPPLEDDDDDDDDDDAPENMSLSSSSYDSEGDDGIHHHHRRRDFDDDDDDEEAALGSLSDRDSIRHSLAADGSDAADPRVVFAPWAHLVLNGEPDTVFRQPWYETIDEVVVEDALAKVREMAREAVRKKLHVPRAEYVVRQPGFLEEADKELEDKALGGDDGEWPEEFEPDE